MDSPNDRDWVAEKVEGPPVTFTHHPVAKGRPLSVNETV